MNEGLWVYWKILILKARVKITYQTANNNSLVFIAYISGGKRFPLAPLGICTLITVFKLPAEWSKWRSLQRGGRPLLLLHGGFHLFTTKSSRVTSSTNPEVKISLTKPGVLVMSPFEIPSRENGSRMGSVLLHS
jgi:hypothetical protein